MERRRPIKGMIFRNKPETSSSESETEKSDQESVSLFHRASLDIPDPREHQHETSDDDHEQVEHNSLQGDKFINNTFGGVFDYFDRFFSVYTTDQKLRVYDKRLGYTYLVCLTLLVIYFIFYIFLIEKSEFQVTKSNGQTFISTSGPKFTYLDSNKNIQFFDTNLLIQKGKSNLDNLLLPVRLRVTSGQEPGECTLPNLPCRSDVDCDVSSYPMFNLLGKCKEYTTGKMGCTAVAWCPSPDPENSTITNVFDVMGALNQTISFETSVVFPDHTSKQIVTNKTQNILFPDPGFNQITVKELLELADVPYDAIRLVGALLDVSLKYECNTETMSHCKYSIDAKWVDKGSGYTMTNINYFTDSQGRLTRTHYSYSGINIRFTTVGYLTSVSPANIILDISTAIALLCGIAFLTNFLMLNVFCEKNHYNDAKYQEFDCRARAD